MTSPPLVIQDDGPDAEGGNAAGQVVATYLLPNNTINQTRQPSCELKPLRPCPM